MGEKLKDVRTALNLTQDEFGGRLGVSGAAISRIEKGQRNLTEQMAKAICREFNISRAWLETGIGPMKLEADQDAIKQVEDIMEGENKTAKALFAALARLSDDEWAVVEKLLDYVEEQRHQRDVSS